MECLHSCLQPPPLIHCISSLSLLKKFLPVIIPFLPVYWIILIKMKTRYNMSHLKTKIKKIKILPHIPPPPTHPSSWLFFSLFLLKERSPSSLPILFSTHTSCVFNLLLHQNHSFKALCSEKEDHMSQFACYGVGL